MLDTISETLKRGGDVAFTGFGKFSVSDRSARQGVNPQTGEKEEVYTYDYFYDEQLVAILHWIDPIKGSVDKEWREDKDGKKKGKAIRLFVALRERQREIDQKQVPKDVQDKAIFETEGKKPK